MRRLFSMVTFLLSILLLSGCSKDLQEFHYNADVAEEEESEEGAVGITSPESFDFNDINFALTNDNAGSFITQNDIVSVFFIGRGYDKYRIYCNVNYSGLCSLRINITYGDGSADCVDYSIINASFQHYFVLECVDDVIKDIKIDLAPVDGKSSDIYELGDDSDVRLLSDNTIESHINGIIELYDEYSTAISVLDVEKGETYVVNTGATKFSVLNRR